MIFGIIGYQKNKRQEALNKSQKEKIEIEKQKRKKQLAPTITNPINPYFNYPSYPWSGFYL